MLQYKFKRRNHLCSLVWTLFLLITVTKENKLINGVTCAALFGLPTIVAGINLREKAECDRRRQIIRMITEKQMLTVEIILKDTLRYQLSIFNYQLLNYPLNNHDRMCDRFR